MVRSDEGTDRERLFPQRVQVSVELQDLRAMKKVIIALDTWARNVEYLDGTHAIIISLREVRRLVFDSLRTKSFEAIDANILLMVQKRLIAPEGDDHDELSGFTVTETGRRFAGITIAHYHDVPKSDGDWNDILVQMVRERTHCDHQLKYGFRPPKQDYLFVMVGPVEISVRCPICHVKFCCDPGNGEIIEAPPYDPKLIWHEWEREKNGFEVT